MKPGILFLVATPLGNLEDITLRALRILREVDLVAAEDTRHTARLLGHYGISTPQASYHEHNEASRSARLLDLLRQGKRIALVSDAGTPLISDPGHLLVEACRHEGIPVVPIPGPVAAVAALSASGLSTESFYFAGFLNSRRTQRRKKLEELRSAPGTLVFYEAPHRILATLEDMCEILGPRPACLVREMTKVHEEWLQGTLPEIREQLGARGRVPGEITLVVDRGESQLVPSEYPSSMQQHLDQEIAQTGASRQDALRSVARQRGISRRQAYQELLDEEKGQPSE